MTDEAVVLFGPNAIRGPGVVDEQHARIALECIDDRLALVDDRVVHVDELWHDVMCSAVGAATRCVVVLPSWWPSHRSSLVVGALSEVCEDVDVWYRVDVLRTDEDCVVVEIADEFVAVHDNRTQPAAIPRAGDVAAIGAAVVDLIESRSAVVIDTPSGVADARVLGDEIARGLRARGQSASIADDGTLVRAVRIARQRRHARPRSRFVQPRAAVVAASLSTVAALTCAAVGSGAEEPVAAESVWVVEGRVTIEVPAQWKVERVTGGPGSARLQVLSPSDPHVAIQLTQSTVPTWQSLTSAAEVLRNSLAAQPQGVFVGFTTGVRRADRVAITYREVRPEHVVDWTVLLEGGVRIAIGCQGAPDRDLPGWICDRAIGSARVLA